MISAVDAMRTLGLTGEGAMVELRGILAAAPHRLSGSAGAAAAVDYVHKRMAELGFSNVRLEPTMVPSWSRGKPETLTVTAGEAGQVMAHDGFRLAAIGGSVATGDGGLRAEVVLVGSLDEIAERSAEVKGRVVFLDPPVPLGLLESFGVYSALAKARVHGASEAARHGAVGLLTRSITTRRDDNPHTGMLAYKADVPKIPAAALGYQSADRLRKLLASGSRVQAHMQLHCSQGPDVESFNVTGEITGWEKPNEVIVIGAHLDSWDLGPGAHDDAAGCAQSIEALKLIAASGVKPRRTIRAVLYMNEEFGGTGGIDYARSAARMSERHLLAVESDRGGFTPRGFSMNAPPEVVEQWNRYVPILKGAGIDWFVKGGSGVDVRHLEEIGALCMGFVPDSQRYMDLHHSANDVVEEVHPRELELGAVAMAGLALIASELEFNAVESK